VPVRQLLLQVGAVAELVLLPICLWVQVLVFL
jgi:hypothetical protein